MPSASPGTELLTVEDYRATPEGKRYQLVEGDLHMAPAPSFYHGEIALNIATIIKNFLAQNPLGKVAAAPSDVYLSEHNVVQPDVYFIARQNLGIIAADGVHGAPDLVIEVLSPSNALLDKRAKRSVYARAGVKELWLVDPILLQIQRYDFSRDPAKPVQFIEETESLTTPLLPGLTISAADVFRR